MGQLLSREDEEDYDRENFNSLDYDDIEALDLTVPADVDMVIGEEEEMEDLLKRVQSVKQLQTFLKLLVIFFAAKVFNF